MEPSRIHPEVKKIKIDARSLMEQNMARRERGEPILHKCSQCGACGVWGPTWTWYGSQIDEDAGKVAKFCSAECMGKEPVDKVLRRERSAT
jgi:ferredoxin